MKGERGGSKRFTNLVILGVLHVCKVRTICECSIGSVVQCNLEMIIEIQSSD